MKRQGEGERGIEGHVGERVVGKYLERRDRERGEDQESEALKRLYQCKNGCFPFAGAGGCK